MFDNTLSIFSSGRKHRVPTECWIFLLSKSLSLHIRFLIGFLLSKDNATFAFVVDKVKLLDQRVCPIYPERVVNPNSKTLEYKGKTVYFWSSSAQRRWKRDPEKYFKDAVSKGHLPQFK